MQCSMSALGRAGQTLTPAQWSRARARPALGGLRTHFFRWGSETEALESERSRCGVSVLDSPPGERRLCSMTERWQHLAPTFPPAKREEAERGASRERYLQGPEEKETGPVSSGGGRLRNGSRRFPVARTSPELLAPNPQRVEVTHCPSRRAGTLHAPCRGHRLRGGRRRPLF